MGDCFDLISISPIYNYLITFRFSSIKLSCTY